MQLDDEVDDVESERPQLEDVPFQLAVAHQLRFRQLGDKHLRRRHRGQGPLGVVLVGRGCSHRRREVAGPDVVSVPHLPERRVGRVGPARQRPGTPGEFVDGEASHLPPVGVEVQVVVDVAVLVDQPPPIGGTEPLCLTRAYLAVERLRTPVRLGQDALAEREQQHAPQQAEAENWNGHPVQADAARLHDCQLAGPRQQADGDEGGHQRGDGEHVGNVLRRGVPEVRQQLQERRLLLEELVGEIKEGADVEDPEQADERERHPVEVDPRHVPVQQVDAPPDGRGDRHDCLRITGPARRNGLCRTGSRHKPRQRRAPFDRTRTPPDQHDTGQAEHRVRDPPDEVRGQPLPLGHRRAQIHQHVVREDDRNAESKARQPSFLAVADPQTDGQQHEDEARHGNGELLVQRHDRLMRRVARCTQRDDLVPQLADRELVESPRGSALGKQRRTVELDGQLLEVVDLVPAGVRRVHPMPLPLP